jgi:hypothetical protein
MTLHAKMLDEPPSSRRRWLLAGLLALAVAGILGVVGHDHSRARKTSSVETSERASGGRTRGLLRLGVRDKRTGPAPCWQGLAQIDGAMTLASFRELAVPLLASGDELVAQYLAERLAELIGDDSQRALEVLAWASDADGDGLAMVLEALRGTPAIHAPEVARELGRMAIDPALDPDQRALLVAALDTQRQLPPELVGELAALAKADDDSDAAWIAARTLGRVMNEHTRAGGDPAAYLDQLLDISARASDAQVRSVALEMPMHSDLLLDAATTARLASVVARDPDPDVKLTAIHDLSLGRDRDQVLSIYEDAFRVDPNVCVRWALFRFSARAAGPRALPTMKRMAHIDPRFARDYDAFAVIYASGVVDFERVWASLPDDDPHHCLLHEEEGES